MKNIKRIVSLSLVLLLAASLVPAACFAGDTQTVSAGISYEPELASLYGEGFLLLGDSYARGMGGTDDWESLYYMDNEPGKLAYKLDTGTYVETNVNCRNIEGGFGCLIADALGCSRPDDIRDTEATYWPIAQNALTLAAVMDLCGVEDNFFDDTFFHKLPYAVDRYNADLYYFGSSGKSTNADGTGVWTGVPQAKDINELIKDSKLIVIELGLGDILNRTFATINYNGMLDNLNNVSSVKEVLELGTKLVSEGYAYWEKNYPVFIDYIRSINPDATIVAVSALNAFFGTTISDSTLAPVGNLLSGFTIKMNSILKEICEEKGLVYVDVSNIDTAVNEEEMDISDVIANLEPATHPTKEGHRQIARMIISELKKYNGIEDSRKYDVVIDTGRFEKVDSVSVNGIPYDDYEFDNHRLTVHCNTCLATNLTMRAVRNGKLSLSVYQLSYNCKDGYKAYRMYTTNNILRAAENSIAGIKDWKNKLLSGIQ